MCVIVGVSPNTLNVIGKLAYAYLVSVTANTRTGWIVMAETPTI